MALLNKGSDKSRKIDEVYEFVLVLELKVFLGEYA